MCNPIEPYSVHIYTLGGLVFNFCIIHFPLKRAHVNAKKSTTRGRYNKHTPVL